MVGPLTLSSGEAVAVAFKGRRQSTIIGDTPEPGYAEATGWFPITADVTVNLSTAFFVDRNGMVVRRALAPDRLVHGWNFDRLERDPGVIAALNWLARSR